MADSEFQEKEMSALRSWLLVVAIAAAFLVWGFLVYYSVGDKGVPRWNFGVVEDIPGQSPYSTHQTKQFPGVEPPSELAGQNVTRQHVMEPPERSQLVPQQGER